MLATALGGKEIRTTVEGPLGKKVRAAWSVLGDGRTAVIEMARASGLALVHGKNKIMEATSIGTGQLIQAALAKGCRTIYIGVGGTACSDGGAGALAALGFRYFDNRGTELSANPKELLRLARIDRKHLDARLKRARIHVLCDVTNPLLGPRGSARTYGPQKGATPVQVRLLEKMLRRWSTFARPRLKNKPGVGAAGALAFGLVAFANATLVAGTPFVMKRLNWARAARGADIIFTGEGRLDKTSLQGKVAGEILKRRGKSKVVVVCGSNLLTRRQTKAAGIDQCFTLKEFL